MADIPTALIPKSLGFLQRIVYGGPIGKLTAASVTATIILGIISATSGNDRLTHLTGMGLVALIVLATFWFIRKIVNEHPDLATLEGQHVIDLAQLQSKMKNRPAVSDLSVSPDPTPPMIEAPREEEE